MTRPPHRRSGLAGALALLCAGLLTSCAGVPTSGAIRQGPVVDSGEATQFIRVIAAPPSAGATPVQVVRGFLEANASLEDDSSISRQYLTPRAAEDWDPSARTTVYSLPSLDVSAEDSLARVALDVTGELLADGTLLPVDPVQRRRITMTLEQVPAGPEVPVEWRITDPPDELLVSDSDLRRAFRLHHVFFLGDRAGVLVPDGRLLPVVGASLPTALALQVLAGPAQWLAPGVSHGLPPGTGLAFGAVPVADGVASVELSEEARMATPEQRRALAAELTWTLTQLPDVTSVRIVAGAEPFDVPGAPSELGRDTWQPIAPDSASHGSPGSGGVASFRLQGASLVRVSDVARTAMPLPAEVTARSAGLAVSLDQRRASVVSRDRRQLWLLPLDTRAATQSFTGRRIGAGSFDHDGRLWFTEDGAVHRVTGPRTAPVVRVVGGPDAPVTAVRLARDGTRVALVAGGQLYLGVIRADADGAVSIVSAHTLVVGVRDIVDVAWRDATELDVLGSLSGAGQQVLRITVGSGQAQGLRAPAGAVDVAAAPGATTLALTSADELFGNVGLQWREQGSARSVAYPG